MRETTLQREWRMCETDSTEPVSGAAEKQQIETNERKERSFFFSYRKIQRNNDTEHSTFD